MRCKNILVLSLQNSLKLGRHANTKDQLLTCWTVGWLEKQVIKVSKTSLAYYYYTNTNSEKLHLLSLMETKLNHILCASLVMPSNKFKGKTEKWMLFQGKLHKECKKRGINSVDLILLQNTRIRAKRYTTVSIIRVKSDNTGK